MQQMNQRALLQTALWAAVVPGTLPALLPHSKGAKPCTCRLGHTVTGDLGMLTYGLIPSHPKVLLLTPYGMIPSHPKLLLLTPYGMARGTPEEQSLAEPSLPAGDQAMVSPLSGLSVLGHDEDGLLIEGYFY